MPGKSNTNSAGQKPTFPFFQVLASSFWIVRYHQFCKFFFCKFFSGHNLKMINTHVSNPPTFPFLFLAINWWYIPHPTSRSSAEVARCSTSAVAAAMGRNFSSSWGCHGVWQPGGKGMDVMCSTVDMVNQRKSKHVFEVCSICFLNVICNVQGL